MAIRRSDVDSFLQTLPEVLEYTGEFGAELVLFLPFCEWLSSQGLLRDRSVCIYAGMRCFYDRLKCRDIIEKTEDRCYIAPGERPPWMPIRDEHSFDISTSKRFFNYPDLRSRFSNYTLPDEIALSKKPLLIIHNKYNIEWESAPVNYLSLASLDKLLSELESIYTIVYVRHGEDPGPGYSQDHNTPLFLNDAEILERHPTVLSFEGLYRHRSQAYDLNTLKNAIYSRCYHFISVQGGGAHHIALFSGSLMAILHRYGQESRWAYSSGYYGFMADPPPIRAICSNDQDLDSVIPIFSNSNFIGGKLRVDDAVKHLLQRLSPERSDVGLGESQLRVLDTP
jgi:hypothetical protein